MPERCRACTLQHPCIHLPALPSRQASPRAPHPLPANPENSPLAPASDLPPPACRARPNRWCTHRHGVSVVVRHLHRAVPLACVPAQHEPRKGGEQLVEGGDVLPRGGGGEQGCLVYAAGVNAVALAPRLCAPSSRACQRAAGTLPSHFQLLAAFGGEWQSLARTSGTNHNRSTSHTHGPAKLTCRSMDNLNTA